MTPHEALKSAREIITLPEHWTKGSVAKTIDGFITHTHKDDAYCFCAIGALSRVVPVTDQSDTFAKARNELRKITKTPFVSQFNDTHTHAEVLAAFDQAIAATAPAT